MLLGVDRAAVLKPTRVYVHMYVCVYTYVCVCVCVLYRFSDYDDVDDGGDIETGL